MLPSRFTLERSGHRFSRHGCSEHDAGERTERNMPRRADELIDQDRGGRARRNYRQPERPLPKAHGKAEEIDWQQEVEPELLRVRDEPAEIGTEAGFDHPRHPERRAEAEIPGEAHCLARLAPPFRLRKLRIGKQEEGERLLQERPVRYAPAEGGRVEDVAKIDGEDRKDDQPWRDLLAEQFDADHLAGAAIDGGAHQHRLEDRKAVVHGESAEQDTEWYDSHDHGHAGAYALHEFAQRCAAIDRLKGHPSS